MRTSISAAMAIALIASYSGCGQLKGVQGTQGPTGDAGKPCTVTAGPNGAIIACPDGTSQTVSNGEPGPTGPQGTPAAPCTVSQNNEGALLECPGSPDVQITNGEDGSPGAAGAPGQDAASCTVTTVPADQTAPSGGALIACPGDSSALVLNGTAGAPGTVITPVQFCSGTGSYPSTFPEVGFCVGGSLWAVYSANGGFLTEVLPGQWSSNGINSSCTFTVGDNCQVTEN